METQPPQKGAQQPPIFGRCLLWPNGWMTQDATWCKNRPRPGHIVLDGDPPLPPPQKKNGGTAPEFSARVYCVQTVAHLNYC